MTVGRICLREVVVAAADDAVPLIARQMRDNNVGTVVVLDRDRRPIGMITDRDLALRVLAEGLDPDRTLASLVMTAVPECAAESTEIETALLLMRNGRFRRLSVVDQHGRLVGIVTLDDILELLCEEFDEVGALLRSEEPARVLVG